MVSGKADKFANWQAMAEIDFDKIDNWAPRLWSILQDYLPQDVEHILVSHRPESFEGEPG